MNKKYRTGDCQACGYKTTVSRYRCAHHIQAEHDEEQSVWLCYLCAKTASGRALDYPTHYDAGTLSTICYVGNAILDALEELEPTRTIRPKA